LQGESLSVNDVNENTLRGIDMLVVGSPINAWRPTPKIKKLLGELSEGDLSNVKAVAFDTRVKILISGNAAKRISQSLESKGATIIAEPKGFYVKESEGPLLEGEIKNAKSWAKSIKAKLK
jgi:flavodoxin